MSKQDKYIEHGLDLWIDSIENGDNVKLIDQTNNYQIQTLEGQVIPYDNYIYLTDSRFLVPCSTLFENDYTITVTYKRFNTNLGVIWSLAEPSTVLNGTIRAGYYNSSILEWSASTFRDWDYLNTDYTPHEITMVFDRTNDRVMIYDNGTIKSTWHNMTSSYPYNPDLKLIIGGYIDNDKLLDMSGLYSLRVYNRALTDAEIKYNYNIDKARFNI